MLRMFYFGEKLWIVFGSAMLLECITLECLIAWPLLLASLRYYGLVR